MFQLAFWNTDYERWKLFIYQAVLLSTNEKTSNTSKKQKGKIRIQAESSANKRTGGGGGGSEPPKLSTWDGTHTTENCRACVLQNSSIIISSIHFTKTFIGRYTTPAVFEGSFTNGVSIRLAWWTLNVGYHAL